MARLSDPLVLLAGGKSSRVGRPKGLIEFRGKTWLEEQVIRFRTAGGARVVVVLAASAEEYLAAVSRITVRGISVETVVNPYPEHGPFSSIQCGLRASDLTKGAFVLPIDVPCPEPRVFRALVAAKASAALPSIEGRGGHPVWISRDFARELLKKPATSRLDEALVLLPPDALVRVDASDPSVRMNLNTRGDWESYSSRSETSLEVELGHDAGLLSLVEVGLGSVIHAFHVPAGGHVLSLNQGFLLSRSSIRTRARSAGMRISAIAALLKSLSPAGKKLTPMLAISIQGMLFSAGTTLLGTGVLGAALGSMLLSAWGFAQPLLVSYLIFGKSFFEVAQILFERASEILSFPRTDLLHVILGLAAAKAALAGILAWGAAGLPETFVAGYLARLRAIALRAPMCASTEASKASGALRDLARPIFLVPLLLNFVFLLYAESRQAAWIWGLLRPLAVGYFTFLLVRIVPFERIALKLNSPRRDSSR